MMLVVVASTLALTACAGSSDAGPNTGGCGGGASAGASPAAQTVKVVADANTVGAYAPPSVTVKVGDTIEWTWVDPGNQHSVTADSGNFDSGLCSQGATFDQTFSSAGSIPYHCTIHAGMHGTVVVTA
jgi:plastocyanin